VHWIRNSVDGRNEFPDTSPVAVPRNLPHAQTIFLPMIIRAHNVASPTSPSQPNYLIPLEADISFGLPRALPSDIAGTSKKAGVVVTSRSRFVRTGMDFPLAVQVSRLRIGKHLSLVARHLHWGSNGVTTNRPGIDKTCPPGRPSIPPEDW
jgi:hypothetical protein